MNTNTLELASLSVPPGERLAATLTIAIAGLDIQVPVFLINGAKPGPRLTMTAGIHGAEYASIETALRLGRTLEPAAISGQIVIIPIANPTAFTARSIYVTPVDGKNLNRQFPGMAAGTFSQALAHWLFDQIIRPSDAYIDLHGGDLIEALVPFVIYAHTGDDEVDQASAKLAQGFGIHYVLEGKTPGSTYQAASRAGIPSILAEAGGQGIWSEENIQLLVAGVLRSMIHLGMLDLALPPAEPAVLLHQWAWLRSEHSGLFYPQVQVGQHVDIDQTLGRVTDAFGNMLQTLHAPMAGLVLFLVTSLAMNQGDPLLAIAA
jgi:hypothetical protein